MKKRIALLLLLFASCHRPVAGRQPGASVLDHITVEPRFVRENVPIRIELFVIGAAPTSVSYQVAGISRPCTPERLEEGRYLCVDPGLDRATFPQGSALVVVETTDGSNRKSLATAPITVDFDCPRVTALRITSGAREVRDGDGALLTVSEPGADIALSIESSEPLDLPPLVSRGGHPWSVSTGAERTWAVSQQISAEDPASPTSIVVRVTDRAGNSSGDLCPDGALSFAVDHAAPIVEAGLIHVTRGAPGTPTTLKADPGAFADDVGILEVRVLDGAETQLALIQPRADGAIPLTNLQTQTSSRVTIQAIDFLGRSSPLARVRERWQLSVGNGSVAGAAIRTATRLTPGRAESLSMENRTAELAADILASDGRAAVVHAEIGFKKVGTLPNSYESRFGAAAGYDPVGDATVIFGGSVIDANDDLVYGERTIILRWSERDQSYVSTMGPTPARGVTPPPRRSTNIAFDDRGCGVMFGGDGYTFREDGTRRFQYHDDVWQICAGPEGYRWTEILPQGEKPIIRIAPVVWDPQNRRYLVPNGESQAFGRPFDDVFILETSTSAAAWRWSQLEPLPSGFNARRGHLAYWDPKSGGLALALGFVQPVGNGEQRLFWTYRNGQWSATTVPSVLAYREDFGAAYDTARARVVLWGGDSYGGDFPRDGNVWFMTGSSTTGPQAWRQADHDAPIPRWGPSVVYDAAREHVLVFAGFRRDRFVPPDVHALIAEPSWPYLETTIALGTHRPPGIERIELELDVDGTGDADGTGPERSELPGIEALIWDYNLGSWAPLATWDGGPKSVVIAPRSGAPIDSFLSFNGHLTIKMRTVYPATEVLSARLVVDRIEGALVLTP